MQQASRQADTAPFYGGASLAVSQSNHDQACTTGMKVFRSGTAALVTAAHCGDPGTAKYTPAGTNVGTMGTWSAGTYRCGGTTGDDMALISGKSYGRYIYLGGVNSSTSGPVINAGNPAVGVAQYRYSGAASGENGLYEVVNDDWDTYMDPDFNACNPWIINTLYIRAPSGGCAVIGGDSGAPFAYRDNYNNVQIRGMIFARRTDGTACFAEKWSRIANQLNVTIAT